MGNAAAKEFKEKELGSGSQEANTAFAESFITNEAMSLKGKTRFGAVPGYSYDKEKDELFSTQAEGALGRKGSVHDAEKNLVAYVRIDHQRQASTQYFYKTEPVYEGQEAAEEKVDDKAMYLFSKIVTSRSGSDIHSTYSVVTGKDEFQALYKGKRIIAHSFKALVETEDGTAVAKINSVFGPPKLTLEVASGVDLAAVVLTGEAVAPNGDMVSQLPGASFGP